MSIIYNYIRLLLYYILYIGGDNVIPEQSIKIHICNSNITYYKKLGYDVVSGNDYLINVKDLPLNCNTKIKVICDYCGDEFMCSKNTLNRGMKYIQKHSCKKCQRRKMEDVMLVKYGEDNPSKIKEINEKRKKTCLEKYGTEYQICSKSTQDKIKNTFIEKYGVTNLMYVPEVVEKKKHTCLEKYGVEYPLQNKDIYCKTVSGRSRTYGQTSSKQQRYISNLYEAQLNIQIGKYFIDMYLEEYNIFVEYDGGGHNLQVKFGNMSQEEFDSKEKERSDYIKSTGLKEFRLKSTTDKLPCDEKLLYIKSRAINILNIYSTYIYNLDDDTEYYE